MSRQRLRILRLKKQEVSLQKQPIENAFVKRVDDLKFYYCLYNLEDDFKDGFYFGLLDLHPQYPFFAPKLFMYTPNGRYEQNMAICTSFTNYHQESWTSAWNVRSLIQATISFMYANEPSYGCKHDSSVIRKKNARDSLGWNMKNDLFVGLFGEKIRQELPRLIKLGIKIEENLIKLFKSGYPVKQIIEPQRKFELSEVIEVGDRIDVPLLDNTVQVQQNQLNDGLENRQIPIIFNEDPDDQRRKKDNKRRKLILAVLVVGVIVGGLVVNSLLKK